MYHKTKHSNSKTIRGHIDIDFPGEAHLSIYWPPLELTDRSGHRSKRAADQTAGKDEIGPSVNLSRITPQLGQQGAIESQSGDCKEQNGLPGATVWYLLLLLLWNRNIADS